MVAVAVTVNRGGIEEVEGMSTLEHRVDALELIQQESVAFGNLTEKAKYLEQQRKSYDDYIEQSMKTARI